jgi:hypothetical protein
MKLLLMKIMSLLLLILPTGATSASAQPWYQPDRLTTQSMGYTGVSAFGVTYRPTNWYEWDSLYGFSPASMTGQVIHSLTVRNRFFWSPAMMASRGLEAFATLGLISGSDDELFFELPNQYPKYYYPPTAIRGLIGGGLRFTVSERWQAYVEGVYLDSEVAPMVYHSDDIPWYEFGSVGLGLQWNWL